MKRSLSLTWAAFVGGTFLVFASLAGMHVSLSAPFLPVAFVVTLAMSILFGTLFHLIWTLAMTAERRRAAGQCATCGYSLRGNISGTCPECGTPVKPE